jgi:hypothetical protein
MTARGVVLGLLLGLLISAATYFNDWVIGQTQLIGNHLPISVFGIAVFALLVVNPLLRRGGRGWPLKASEIAVMIAIGLAACGWPGSNFYRGFTTVTALPSHWLKTDSSWQANKAMSYVPGASAELGQGHVQDWRGLVTKVQAASAAGAPSPARQVWLSLGDEGQRLFEQAARQQRVEPSQIADLVRSLNEALHKPSFYQQPAFQQVSVPEAVQALLTAPQLSPDEVVLRNRHLLVAAFPGQVLPPPAGRGALLDGGRADPFVVGTLLQGRSASSRLSVRSLPWSVWWPTLRLWGSVALLLGACALCLALIMHPQWSKRELLSYPIARVVEEVAERKAGRTLPEIARSRLFWIGFGVLVFWHTLNGLHAWFPDVPEIPRKFDLGSLGELFPNAVRVSGQYGWFVPTIYLSVIAFSFFLPTSVSFSLGISHILFFMLGSVLLAYGVSLEHDDLGTRGSDLMRFGAYVGFALIIAYTGRRYFKNVMLSALGRARAADTPAYATWAMRILLLAVVLATLVLSSSGLGWVFSGLFVFLLLLTVVVMTRIVVETGAFFVQTSWTPVGALTALIGFDAVGPTAFILMALASVALVLDPRETLMPFLANGLRIADREGGAPPRTIAPWLFAMTVIGFVVAGVVTLYLQYNYSVTQVGNDFATHYLPKMPFDTLSRYGAESAAQGTLARATAASGWSKLSLVQPEEGAVLWLTIGVVLALGTAAARLRLPWWPLHPVAFLIWNTYPIIMFGPSFLLGWLVKAAVVGMTGARGYHAVRPLMIGVIAGELLSGLFWMGVGALYFFITGKTPATYSIFPG